MAAGRPSGVDSTAVRLLDAAERLFGEHGYDGVGMRMLAQAARVNLGAATYHFGSKKALYVETFLRRFRSVSREQGQLLDAAQQAAGRGALDLEQIVEALIRPGFLAGLEHPAFNRLLARTLVAPPPFLRTLLRRELEPNAQRFVQALQRALPALPLSVLQLRMALVSGALMMVAMRVASLPKVRDAARERATLQELVRFAGSGLASAAATSGAELVFLDSANAPHPARRA
ncbi:MAG TPA: TetR/AcrR family transcriptional regulator [Steroidobacteraceae bacterium]|nr:TetR/AcrR family transcriptional regulator [Steroidobacteraceae bacterium]